MGRAAAIGVGKHFTRAIQSLLQEYVAGQNEDDLVFASDFSDQQRKQIHSICRRMNLKSVSFGKDSNRQLTVQKKKTATQLLRLLIEIGGENGKYKILWPTGYKVE